MRLLFVSVPWLPHFPTVREGLANHVKETWERILVRTTTQVNAPWVLIPLNNAATPKTRVSLPGSFSFLALCQCHLTLEP